MLAAFGPGRIVLGKLRLEKGGWFGDPQPRSVANIRVAPVHITDGQIYLSPTLFELGILPAGRVGACLADVGLPSAGAVTLLKEDETSDDKRSDPG
jgi:hypothetical protein